MARNHKTGKEDRLERSLELIRLAKPTTTKVYLFSHNGKEPVMERWDLDDGDNWQLTNKDINIFEKR